METRFEVYVAGEGVGVMFSTLFSAGVRALKNAPA
jgi:hypothetical protein